MWCATLRYACLNRIASLVTLSGARSFATCSDERCCLPSPGAATFTEAMRMGSEVYHHLKSVIKNKYGQDGGWKRRQPIGQNTVSISK